eukprot:768804-Hanusia_phi.AAC.6
MITADVDDMNFLVCGQQSVKGTHVRLRLEENQALRQVKGRRQIRGRTDIRSMKRRRILLYMTTGQRSTQIAKQRSTQIAKQRSTQIAKPYTRGTHNK